MKYTLVILLMLFTLSCSNPVNEKRIIDEEQLTQIISQKDKTLVYIWTTWCGSCRTSLVETLPKLAQKIDGEDYQLVLIAASKDSHVVDSMVKASGLANNSYFLNFIGPDKGKFHSLGIRQFLNSNFPGEKIYNRSIPVFFMVDRHKKVLAKKLPNSYDEVMEVLN